MASDARAPINLYIAAYTDPDEARGDWDAIKQLAADDVIKVDGLVLVSRRSDGNLHVDDDFHTAAKGAAWGAILASAAVGTGVGLGAGSLLSHKGEGSDQGRRRRHFAAQQLRDRGAVRGAAGHRGREDRHMRRRSPSTRSTGTAWSRSRPQSTRHLPRPVAGAPRRRSVSEISRRNHAATLHT